ncbi:KIN17 [Symbiodinium necroappetens]|uniref:KIN17 protein n=1 Tax=Symbiodinium necroappetens TaxID=1628268 RepID=A0A813BXM4_9DINO|nr:KIN17 [Symbiodinium necroappetens]
MKAKGLQKLRWYCQMCQKQCRDENGFKCHRMSDGHQRQMQLFVQDPNRFMDEFSQDCCCVCTELETGAKTSHSSEEFERGFMQLMSACLYWRHLLLKALVTDMFRRVICRGAVTGYSTCAPRLAGRPL